MTRSPPAVAISVLVLTIVSTLAVVGCITVKSPPRAPFTYYETASFAGVFDEHRVELDLQIEQIPSGRSRDAFALSDRGQAQLIEVYGGNEAISAKLPALLAEPISRTPPVNSTDRSRVFFSKRLNFGVAAIHFHPPDRIYSAVLTAKVPPGWTFKNWRGFEIKEEAIKLAVLEQALTNKATSSVSLSVPQIDELGDLSAGRESSGSSTVTRDLNVKVVEFVPILSGAMLEIVLNSPFPQTNVAGRYSIDVDIEYDDPVTTSFVDVAFEDGLPKLSLRQVMHVTNPKDETLQFTLDYVTRLVHELAEADRGAATVDEGDDQARYSSEETTGKTIMLLDEEATSVSFLQLELNEKPLRIFVFSDHLGNRASAQCLRVVGAQDAQAFTNWLNGELPKKNFTFKSGEDLVWEILDAERASLRNDRDYGPDDFRWVAVEQDQVGDLEGCSE